jgi:hypothetical protein
VGGAVPDRPNPEYDADLLRRLLVAHRRDLFDRDAMTEDDRRIMYACCGYSSGQACCIDYLMPDTRAHVRRNR